jgi:hypothetical protein
VSRRHMPSAFNAREEKIRHAPSLPGPTAVGTLVFFLYYGYGE